MKVYDKTGTTVNMGKTKKLLLLSGVGIIALQAILFSGTNCNAIIKEETSITTENSSDQGTEDSALTAPEKQQKILEKHASTQDAESLIALKKLSDASLRITSASLEDVDKDPTKALLKMDMYEGGNLAILVSRSLDYVLSGTDKSHAELTTKIQNNKKLKTGITALKNAFVKLSKYDHIDFDNEKYAEDRSCVMTCFKNVKTEIEADSSFTSKDYFVDFLVLAEKFLDLAFVRYNTEKMLSAIRGSLEGIQGVTGSTSASLAINVPTPIPGASVNLEAFASGESYGSTGLSFYTITQTKGAKAGITYNILPAKISAKIGIDRAAADIFFSLESYMDFLNSSSSSAFSKFQASKNMKATAKDRKDMQQKEKEALANNGKFENYLKLFNVLPHGVSFQYVDITKAKSSNKSSEITLSGEVGANIAIPLASFGVTLKKSTGNKEYTKEAPMLSLVNDDFSIVDGMDIEDLRRILGEENDLSKSVSDSNLLLGTLNSYILALEGLATAESSNSKKEYEKKKHACEELLLPKKLLGSNGRAGVLRSAVLTAAALRKKLPDDREQTLRFKKIYEALIKLAQLNEFSKNKQGIRKAVGYGAKESVGATAKASVDSLQASFSVDVPPVGNTSVSVTKKTVNNSPLLQENGRYITLKASLPIGSAGVVGMGILREKFKSVFAKEGLPVNLDDFKTVAKAFGANAAGQISKRALAAVGAPVGVSCYGSSDFTFVWKYVDPPKDFSSITPLPGMKVIKNYNGRWTLDFVAIATLLNSGINTSSIPVSLPLTLKASASSGKLGKRTGADTFHDILSKFNTLLLGKIDSKSGETTAINSLLSGQSGQLLKSFRGVARPDSNALFELQELYNDIRRNLKDGSNEMKECEKLFANFIKECNELNRVYNAKSQADKRVSENDSASAENEIALLTESNEEELSVVDQYKNAFNLFREILDMQHTHVFKPYYEKAFKTI